MKVSEGCYCGMYSWSISGTFLEKDGQFFFNSTRGTHFLFNFGHFWVPERSFLKNLLLEGAEQHEKESCQIS